LKIFSYQTADVLMCGTVSNVMVCTV